MMIENEQLYLGIDWGEKRIGLALGDSVTKTATPFSVVSNLKELLAIINREKIDALVVGKPVKLSGNEEFAQNFLIFLNQLKISSGLPMQLIDERLTSRQADSLSGGKRNKAERDALAAMLILQTYFDKQINS